MFSGLCLFAAAIVGYYSIVEITTPHHLPAWFMLPVLLLAVVLKEFLSRRVFAAGNDLDSSALKGDARHHRSDAITSAAAALGITVAMIGGQGYERADAASREQTGMLNRSTERNGWFSGRPSRRFSPEATVLNEKLTWHRWL